MTLKDGYGFGGFSRAPPSKQHLSTPPPPPGFEYRRNSVRRPRSSADLRSNFNAKNGLKSSAPECLPMPDRSTGDLFTSSATSKIANKNRWIKNWFGCPANAGRSLKIAAEPAVIEQTPPVFLPKIQIFSSQRSQAGSVLDMWRPL